MNIRLAALPAVALILAAAACAGADTPDDQDAERETVANAGPTQPADREHALQTVKDWLRADIDNDGEKACSMMSEAYQQQIADVGRRAGMTDPSCPLILGDPTGPGADINLIEGEDYVVSLADINGKAADINVYWPSTGDEVDELKLEHTGGRWILVSGK